MGTSSRWILSIETISEFLVIIEIWDFSAEAFECLFLNQLEHLVAQAWNSNLALGMSVPHEYSNIKEINCIDIDKSSSNAGRYMIW